MLYATQNTAGLGTGGIPLPCQAWALALKAHALASVRNSRSDAQFQLYPQVTLPHLGVTLRGVTDALSCHWFLNQDGLIPLEVF